MSELTPEHAVIVLMNKAKQDLSGLAEAILRAMADGSINGWEGFALASQAATVGTSLYSMLKLLPEDVAKAVPGALLKLELKYPDEVEAANPWT